MKKILALLLATMMVFALAACGGNEETPSGSGEQQSGSTPDNQSSGAEKSDDWTQYFSIPGLTTPDGFTVQSANLYAGIGDARFGTVVFEKSGGFTEADIEAFGQMVWDCCMDYSADGIYKTTYVEGKSTKGDAYAAISDTAVSGGYQWKYTDGKHIAAVSITPIGDTLKFETFKEY